MPKEMDRRTYNALYGATTGDHVRLADTNLFARVDALSDVRALLVDRDDHATGVSVEAVAGIVVTDAVDRLAGDLRDVDVGRGRDLTGDHAEAGGQQRLTRDTAIWVLGEDGVEDGVGDLVGHLVGVALGDAFGSERVRAHAKSCRCVERMETMVSMTARATSRFDARSISTGSASGRISVTAFVS